MPELQAFDITARPDGNLHTVLIALDAAESSRVENLARLPMRSSDARCGQSHQLSARRSPVEGNQQSPRGGPRHLSKGLLFLSCYQRDGNRVAMLPRLLSMGDYHV